MNVVLELGTGGILTEDDFKKVCEYTSNGVEPMLPFYLYFDAERAQFNEQYRKSVLDSATATEVCLSQIIRNHLPVSDDLNKYINEKHNSLKQKRELLKILKVTLPENEKAYKDKLDLIRNRVIHAGYNPSRHEAKAALKIAENTLYSLLSDLSLL